MIYWQTLFWGFIKREHTWPGADVTEDDVQIGRKEQRFQNILPEANEGLVEQTSCTDKHTHKMITTHSMLLDFCPYYSVFSILKLHNIFCVVAIVRRCVLCMFICAICMCTKAMGTFIFLYYVRSVSAEELLS